MQHVARWKGFSFDLLEPGIELCSVLFLWNTCLVYGLLKSTLYLIHIYLVDIRTNRTLCFKTMYGR